MDKKILVLIGLGGVLVVTAIDNVIVNQQRLSAMKSMQEHELEMAKIATQKGES